MNKNIIKNCKVIKYKGKKFYLIENNLNFIPGFLFKTPMGKDIISLNRDLSPRHKQLEFHRLLTGRGIRNIKGGVKHA